MTASKFESLWQLMSQHTFEVDPDYSEENFTCVICHRVMIDAYQSVCGCQYCRECIRGYLMGGDDKYCPGNKGECNEEYLVLERDVSRNMRMNSKISKLSVKCPNKECKEKGKLSAIKDHLRVCTFDPVMPEECPSIKVCCVNEGGSEAVLEDYLKDDSVTIVSLRDEWVNEGQIRGMMEEHRQEDETFRNEMMNKLTALEKEMRNESSSVRTVVEHLMKSIEEVRKAGDNLRIAVHEMRGNMDLLTMGGLNDGNIGDGCGDDVWNKLVSTVKADYMWRIEGWMNKMSDERFYNINSDYFYSNGYKFGMTLSKAKNEDAINIYCIIAAGQNDHKISWPMKHPVTVSIMNQRALRTHAGSTWDFETLGNRRAFEIPKRNDFNYIGPFIFKYYTFKQSPCVIVDDSLVVCCVLSDPPLPRQ